MGKALGIVGTDTDVGKTFVAALLLDFLQGQGLAPGYLKLVSCGGQQSPDCQVCQTVAGVADMQLRCLYHFNLAASPHLAAETEGREVDGQQLARGLDLACQDFEHLLVEGAGGLLVPLRRDLLLADFLAEQKLPLLLVVRSGLGTLNHTLLSIEAARARGLELVGILFCDERDYEPDDRLVSDNIATIAQLAGVKVIGRLPRCNDLEQARQLIKPQAKKLFRSLAWL